MRGQVDPQGQIFSYFSPESRVPPDHPLRSIKAHTDRVLKELSAELDALYAETGRPSIPPERLLLLIALYSVRSDRLFCQMLDYNILFRWFLDMSLEEATLDQSNFTRLRERLVGEQLAQRFFDAVVKLARDEGLLSSEHLTVDGTLIEAWAGQRLQAQGRSAIAAGWARRGELPRQQAHQRHPCLHHRSGGEVGAQGCGEGSEALFRRPCTDGKPQRAVRGHPRKLGA